MWHVKIPWVLKARLISCRFFKRRWECAPICWKGVGISLPTFKISWCVDI